MNGRWTVVGSSVAGSSHAARGVACQDAFAHHETDGVVVIAVADGAGSKAKSDVGARIAVERAVAHLAARGKAALDSSLAGAAEAALQAIKEEAASAGAEVSDYAATLLLAVAAADRARVFQIGDGAIVACAAVQNPILVNGETPYHFTWPPRGTYANETTFLTSPAALATAQEAVWPGPIEGIAVITDGLQRVALDFAKARPFDKFFLPLFAFATYAPADMANEKLVEFLGSPKVRKKTDDDVTLVLAAVAVPLGGGAFS